LLDSPCIKVSAYALAQIKKTHFLGFFAHFLANIRLSQHKNPSHFSIFNLLYETRAKKDEQ
jgi:hypothetical protein